MVRPTACTYTKVLIEFEFNNLAPGDRTRYARIDIIRPRKHILQSNRHLLAMPVGLGQFGDLTQNHMLERNFINKTYWKVVKTMWIPVFNKSGVNKSFTTVRSVMRSYKNEGVIRCDLNAADSVGNLYPTIQENVPPHEQEWCVISCDIVPNRLSVLRHTSWRDQNGTSA